MRSPLGSATDESTFAQGCLTATETSSGPAMSFVQQAGGNLLRSEARLFESARRLVDR